MYVFSISAIKIVRERKILNAMTTTLDVQPFNFNLTLTHFMRLFLYFDTIITLFVIFLVIIKLNDK